jgi:hypothetical protein
MLRLPALTLFWRFFFGLLVAALLPLLATWYFARNVTTDNAEHLAESRLRNEATQIAARADGWRQVNYESLA